MTTGLSDAIRDYARANYVLPAINAGNVEFEILVKDVWSGMRAQGFDMSGRTPQICSALKTRKFLEENELAISEIVGPPSGQSPTVVFRYRVIGDKAGESRFDQLKDAQTNQAEETAEEWAHRMTGKLFGLMKDEIAAIGGTEAYIRWVRSEDDEIAKEDAA